MTLIIKQAEHPNEFEQYYALRYRLLREPWGEAEGSEKDELEDQCVHMIAMDADTVIGVGRLQFNSDTEAQIRYMAVAPAHERQGVGRYLVQALEAAARERAITFIVLDAREAAVGFYSKLGYEVTAKSYLLFDCIQHYRMQKKLA